MPSDLSAFAGENLPSVESLATKKKRCFVGQTPVEEFVYCKVLSERRHGTCEVGLTWWLGFCERAGRFGFDCEAVKQAINKLSIDGWIVQEQGACILRRTDFERSVCLQWL